MKAARVTPSYWSPLREEQKEATRQRILEAAGKLMEDRGLEEFSYAAIAAQAGVTERTVYRHFPNKAALLEGLWSWFRDRVRYGEIPRSEEELLALPVRTFPAFEQNEALSRALWASPQGREFRLSNVEARKAGIKAAIAEATRGLPAREATRVAAVIHVLTSSSVLWTMKDYWGFSGEEAGKASATAIRMLLDGARARSARSAKKKE